METKIIRKILSYISTAPVSDVNNALADIDITAPVLRTVDGEVTINRFDGVFAVGQTLTLEEEI